MENKKEICNSLCATLQKTREIVIAKYDDDRKVEVNVCGDSGIALIKDVIRKLAMD